MAGNRFTTKRAKLLDNEERIRELRPHYLLRDVAGVASGMTCVELGSGSGTFSIPITDIVGDNGVIYAVDNSTEMLEYMRAKYPPPNLRLVEADAGQTGLNNSIADFCLLAFILHEVRQPADIVNEAWRLLKPEGKIMIVEWRADRDSPGPVRKRRLSQQDVSQLVKQVGFVGFQYMEWSNNHYVAYGEKPELTRLI